MIKKDITVKANVDEAFYLMLLKHCRKFHISISGFIRESIKKNIQATQTLWPDYADVGRPYLGPNASLTDMLA